MSDHDGVEQVITMAWRAHPGRTRCRGEIIAELNRASGYIEWRCTICGDNGMIHGWKHTLWDRSGPESQTTVPTSATGH